MSPTPAQRIHPINCFEQAQIDATMPHPNKKRIFVFCDGTGNQFADHFSARDANSNVVKLYITIRVNNDQVAYYHPGVGTMGDPAIRNRVVRFWSKVKGLAFGAGFKANVMDAYRYLMAVYNDGDEIYIFGFSRGAYTARALAGMLHAYGLLCRGNEGHVEYVWHMFQNAVNESRKKWKDHARLRNYGGNGHSVKRNSAFLETYSRKVTIRFMGLWDTVSSVGWIYSPVRLLDVAQNPSIQVGRHAVSIDERRANYRDNLWGPPVGIKFKEWSEHLREAGISQDLAQVWFPGAHSDVGGSYPQMEAYPANISLRWMINELKANGAELCEERIDMVLGNYSEHYAADRIFSPKPQKYRCLHHSLTWKWWILQCFPQQYYDKDQDKSLWRVPYGTPRSIPPGSIIHKSAIERMDDRSAGDRPYQPKNLDRTRCVPVSFPMRTTANLLDCYVYDRPKSPAANFKSEFTRYARLVVGWITFALVWSIVLTTAWYLIGAVVGLATLIFHLMTITPGLSHVFPHQHWHRLS